MVGFWLPKCPGKRANPKTPTFENSAFLKFTFLQIKLWRPFELLESVSCWIIAWNIEFKICLLRTYELNCAVLMARKMPGGKTDIIFYNGRFY